MLYPLFFKPIYKNIIWGGRNLEKLFSRELPYDKVAESWEVSCHGNDTSIIENGTLKDMSLDEAIKKYDVELLGENNTSNIFPLLVKFIDANDKLSVQVHPDNEYALKYENDLGKSEMWYIVEAKKGSKLIYGTKENLSKDLFKASLDNGKLEECLNYVDIEKGDVIYIPSGTVHAILDGIVIAEIQQSSNTTYRVYDWNRVDKNGNPRELHVKKALDVINFDFKGNVLKPTFINKLGYKISSAVKCEFFNVDIVKVESSYEDITNGITFYIYNCIDGNGYITYKDTKYDIKAGSSFLIPSSLGKFSITGEMTLLKSYI